MFELDKIVRDNVKRLVPYSSARDEFKGSEGIFLDANENAFGSAVSEGLNRYPDPLQRALKERIAQFRKTDPEQLFMGNGSDEVIDLLIRAFCEPREDNIIIMPPTYGVYEVYAGVNDVEVRRVNLRTDFQLDVPAILAAADEQSRLIFVCSPNNPSGNCMKPEDIRQLAENFDGIVVVDEAYIDFTDKPSALSMLNDYANLFVMQTFSKAWGLASIRLGAGYARPDIIAVLNKIKPPYNINGITQDYALQAFENMDQKQEWIRKTGTERERLRVCLEELPPVEKVYLSDANFLLVKTVDADAVYNYLIGKQIIVRNRSRVPLCENCLRITVGTPEENDKLIEALKAYPSENQQPITNNQQPT